MRFRHLAEKPSGPFPEEEVQACPSLGHAGGITSGEDCFALFSETTVLGTQTQWLKTRRDMEKVGLARHSHVEFCGRWTAGAV